MVVVTKQLIQLAQSGNGGWNRAQLALIGEEWPPRSGWQSRAIGRELSDADAYAFLNNKGSVKRQKAASRAK